MCSGTTTSFFPPQDAARINNNSTRPSFRVLMAASLPESRVQVLPLGPRRQVSPDYRGLLEGLDEAIDLVHTVPDFLDAAFRRPDHGRDLAAAVFEVGRDLPYLLHALPQIGRHLGGGAFDIFQDIVEPLHGRVQPVDQLIGPQVLN